MVHGEEGLVMMMDERKFRILQAIIDDYILTAVPVGSRTISKKYDMGLSSATIRNEMSDLEELGYLDQPHVSAGRIPSAKAYRLYVDQLLKTGRIPSDSDAAVKGHFLGRMHQMEDVIDHAAQVLSSLTSYTAVVLPPTGKMPKIRTIQLVPVSDTSALVVIVTDMGIVRDQVVQVASDLDSDALYAISKTLTERLQGLTLHEAVAQMPQLMQETLQSTIAAFPLSRLLHFRWILVLALVIYNTICGHCRAQIPQPLHLP
jgi:heat-inducible transcriptional repressor